MKTEATKTYVVTGANRGIGLEYCRQIQARGDRAIAICRKPSDDLTALGIRMEADIDITQDDSVADLVQQLSDTSIDVLINNAGIIKDVTLDKLDFDNIRQQFEVNALGPLRVTHHFLPLLHAGSKVVMMSSDMGSIEENTSGGSYGYRMSKAALSIAGKSLSSDLKPKGIAIVMLHPGVVSTRMTEFSGSSPEESVTNLLQRIDDLTLETSGTFWNANGETLPW